MERVRKIKKMKNYKNNVKIKMKLLKIKRYKKIILNKRF